MHGDAHPAAQPIQARRRQACLGCHFAVGGACFGRLSSTLEGLQLLKALLQQRKENVAWFQQRLASTAEKQGLRLLHVPANRISLAVDLTPLAKSLEDKGLGDIDHLTFLGSALFTRRVSGPRVVLCTLPSAPAAAPPDLAESSEGTASVCPAACKGGKRASRDR